MKNCIHSGKSFINSVLSWRTVLIGLVAAFPLSAGARAATFTVNATADAHDAKLGDHRCAAVSGKCTLRAAIEEANAGADPDIIGFQLAGGSTITLSLGQLKIASRAQLKIRGPGAALLSLSGNGTSRLIRIAPGATVSISGITLRDGYANDTRKGYRVFGGALENAGFTTLSGVVIRGNKAPQGGGGIVNGGVLNLVHSQVSGNSSSDFAGGILNTGVMTLIDSAVSANQGGDGAGAIDNRGTATLSDTAISGNASRSSAGGITNRGTLSLIGATVSDNTSSSGVGGIENFASLSLFRTEVTRNHAKRSGGLAGTRGTIRIARSSVSANSGASGSAADCLIDHISAFQSGGRNTFGKGTGCIASGPDVIETPDSRAATVPLDRRIAASSDDAEEKAAGTTNLTSGDLELVYDGSIQMVGMRFPNVTVPRGAAITKAWIQFTVDEAQSETTSLLIRGQATANAPTFTTATFNLSSRAKTGAGVPWSPAAWSTIGQAGPAQQTPDLKDVVQEIVNLSGWSSGNPLVILITGTGHRTADSYDGSRTTQPLLHIEYTGTAPGNQAPVANAGPDVTITLPAGVTLAGSVSDDGLPNPPATVTCGWTKTSGPGSVTFGNAALPSTTATFSTSGAYILRLTCSDSLLTGFDETQITVNPTGGGGPTVAVYAGYYDTHHPYHTMPKPNPWKGASNTIFVGAPDSSSGGWDSSAIRVDNLTSSTLTGVTVTVDIGSSRFALWGQQSIPAGSSLILAQTGSGKFDGSDRNTAGCYSCAESLCTTAISSTIPVVHVTVGATTINVPDSGQIINTRGADSAGCPFYGHGIRSDESESWQQIH